MNMNKDDIAEGLTITSRSSGEPAELIVSTHKQMTNKTKKNRHSSSVTKGQDKSYRKIENILKQQRERLQEIHTQLQPKKKSVVLSFLKAIYIFYREIVAASGIIVLLVTWYLYQANFLSINPSQSLLKENPLRIPFVIENKTLIDIKNIEINSYYHHVVTNVFDLTRGFLGKSHKIPLLKSQGKHTIFFDMEPLIRSKTKELKKADIQLDIRYEALFLNKKFSENFRFIAEKGENGIYYYYPITEIE